MEFSDAARAVRIANKNKVSLPAYYLLGHSIELSLKAFLLARGVTFKELKSKKYGHDLMALLSAARRHRLGTEVPLKARDIGLIQLLNFEYVAKRYEYRETGIYQIPDAALAQDVADRFVQKLKYFCENHTNRP
jgi:hypothetical protein